MRTTDSPAQLKAKAGVAKKARRGGVVKDFQRIQGKVQCSRLVIGEDMSRDNGCQRTRSTNVPLQSLILTSAARLPCQLPMKL